MKKRQRIFKAALELITEHGVRCAPEQDVETELKATAPHLPMATIQVHAEFMAASTTNQRVAKKSTAFPECLENYFHIG
ncbi:MAG: hypothetical protein PHI97_14805 [Desulfobulbus sp.]|nr:hypothetical protein [Desulfobulbus sp.]